MKVLVTCRIEVDPLKRDSALKEADKLIKMARAEPGCNAYNWGADLNENNVIYVHEEWASQEDLTAHLNAPSFFGLSEHLNNHGLQGAVARKFLIEKDGPIYDEEGNPRGDFF